MMECNPATRYDYGDKGACPEAFARRVLFLVTGLTPQIVTETLHALCIVRRPPFIPTRIEVLTTAEGARRARLLLFEKTPGQFTAFCADYHLPQLLDAFSPGDLEVVTSADGAPLADIVTEADNAAVADAIMRRIRDLAADPDCAIHASVAGGRKTMGVALALAMSLFGRPQDRLSHVLVSPPFESHPEFFYPPPEPEVLLSGVPPSQQPVSTEQARVSLATIPFLRLRGLLDEALLHEADGWDTLITRAQAHIGEPVLRMVLPGGRIEAAGREVAMPPSARAFLLMLARRAREGKPGPACPADGAPDEVLAEEYLAALHALEGGPQTHRSEQTLRCGMDKNFFERRKHEVNSALRKALGPGPAKAYEIGRRHDVASGRYCHDLPLKPEQVRIIDEGR